MAVLLAGKINPPGDQFVPPGPAASQFPVRMGPIRTGEACAVTQVLGVRLPGPFGVCIEVHVPAGTTLNASP